MVIRVQPIHSGMRVSRSFGNDLILESVAQGGLLCWHACWRDVTFDDELMIYGRLKGAHGLMTVRSIRRMRAYVCRDLVDGKVKIANDN